MSPSALRARLLEALVEFAWQQWAQMGVFSVAPHASRWVQDPEALLLLTLEIGRDEPRLFDEVLDWLARNEPIVSARRLKTLCDGPEDERLSSAVLRWVARQRRPAAADDHSHGELATEPLFRGPAFPVRNADPAFLSYGFVRPALESSGKSSEPDLTAPINFAFRLRHLLGVGARAEAARFLLTADVPRATTAAVAASAGYTRRNISEALMSLHAAGAVAMSSVGADQRFGVDRGSWAPLLGLDPDDFPVHRDWPQLLTALRRIVRWLSRSDLEDLSDYLRASQARDLLEDVRPLLNHAGVITLAARGGEESWNDLIDAIDYAVLALGPRTSLGSEGGFEIYRDASDHYRWRLKTQDGRIVAVSSESYATSGSARGAVDRLRDSAGASRYRVDRDPAGNFRWQMIDPTGEIGAMSGESFATFDAAERAAYAAVSLAASRAQVNEESGIGNRRRRHVVKRPDGRWANKAEGARRAASVHGTQAEAVDAARKVARNAGGGEVIIHAADGRIRDADTIGHDPSPPRDRQH